MTSVERILKTTPERVWAVLSDGWLYPLWVVGASRMREVDGHWPEVGARLHHSVGSWPALIDDVTEVIDVRPESFLGLRAHAWPAGAAGVAIHLSPEGAGTKVVIEEDASHGPARLVPAPLRRAAITWRNVETLRRLAFIAERRALP